MLLSCFNFGGETGGEVGAEGGEVVENGNDALLLCNRRYFDFCFADVVVVEPCNSAAFGHRPRLKLITIKQVAVQYDAFIVINPYDVGILVIGIFAVINDSSADCSGSRNQDISLFRERICFSVLLELFTRDIGIRRFTECSDFIKGNVSIGNSFGSLSITCPALASS